MSDDPGYTAGMHILVVVAAAPWQSEAADTAWQYTRAALRQKHRLSVFFYHAGSRNADAWATPSSDDRHVVSRWSRLSLEEDEVLLLLCPSVAALQGVLAEPPERRRSGRVSNLAPGFKVAGLSRFAQLLGETDRVITFR